MTEQQINKRLHEIITKIFRENDIQKKIGRNIRLSDVLMALDKDSFRVIFPDDKTIRIISKKEWHIIKYMAKKVKYELTQKAIEYLLANGCLDKVKTIRELLNKMIKNGILDKWEKIDDYNYKITFK